VTGWLLAQLPRAMSANLLVQAFVDAAEHTGDSVRDQLDALEYQLDPDLASPQMLIYMGGWLGFPLDPLDDPALHRPLLRAIGRLLVQRGTKAAVRELLTQLTGGPVTVEDGGGVFGPGQNVPEPNLTVRVELSRIGPVSPERLAAIIERELPIGARLELIVPHEGEYRERHT
jgi:phage tail-like protein